jgi:hypothetical protein
MTLADWIGIVETELFADTYKSYGLATVRHPVLEVTVKVEPFDNGNGYTLRVLRAGKPRMRMPGRRAPHNLLVFKRSYGEDSRRVEGMALAGVNLLQP